jgi:4-amino-4-deoxy-L-arabinose transferase-like glycosyltransferase
MRPTLYASLSLAAKRLSRSEHVGLIFLLVLGFIVIASGLGLRDPWPPDEPRFALVAKEMVESGQWFFPRRGGELYPDKPPLFMWTIAAFYALTGSLRFSFLLPSLLSGLLTLGLVFDISRRLWNPSTGFAAGAVLLFTFQFVAQAKLAQIDAMLCFWTTLGIYGLLRHFVTGPCWRGYYLGFAAMGFGVITKGVGILPVFMLVPYAYGRWRGWKHLPPLNGRPRQWLLGPLLMLGAIGLWLIPLLIIVGMSHDPTLAAYRDEILFRQTVQRYANPWHHYKPFWYFFIQVIPVFWMPVIFALPWLIPAWWRRLRRRDGRYLLVLGWIGLVLGFFTLSAAKRGVYILPAVPALAIAVAPLVPGLLKLRGVQILFSLWTFIVSLAGLGAYFYFATDATAYTQFVQKQGFDPWWILAVIGLTGIIWLILTGYRQGVAAAAGFMITFWLLFGWLGYPTANPARSTAPFMAKVGEVIGPEAELALVYWKEQFMLFADRPVTNFGFSRTDRAQETQEAIDWMLQKDNRWILLRDANLQPCFDATKAIDMGIRHRRHWYLVNPHALTKACSERISANR